jgi:hypothetical protein
MEDVTHVSGDHLRNLGEAAERGRIQETVSVRGVRESVGSLLSY